MSGATGARRWPLRRLTRSAWPAAPPGPDPAPERPSSARGHPAARHPPAVTRPLVIRQPGVPYRLAELADRRRTLQPARPVVIQPAGHAGRLAGRGERVTP